jgi:hypothetical protein
MAYLDRDCQDKSRASCTNLMEDSPVANLALSEPSSRHALDNGPRVINYSRAN